MELILIVIIIILLLGGFALLFWRAGRGIFDIEPLANKLDNLRDFQERTDRSVRDEIGRSRTETLTQSQQERTELAQSFKSFEDSVQARLSELTAATENKIEALRLIIDEKELFRMAELKIRRARDEVGLLMDKGIIAPYKE